MPRTTRVRAHRRRGTKGVKQHKRRMYITNNAAGDIIISGKKKLIKRLKVDRKGDAYIEV